MADEVEVKKYEKIGGWLYLVALGVFTTPFRIGFTTYNIFSAIFLVPGAWAKLTVPGSSIYDPYWEPILIGEVAGNILFTLVSIYIIVLFVNKKKAFPKTYIVFLLLNFAFVVGDYFAADLVKAVANQPSPAADKEVIRTIVACAIWVPYMLKSKRVKGTFVN